MSIRECVHRLRMFWRRGRLEADLRREMQIHVEMLTAERLDEGAGPREAESAARRAFGNELVLRDDCREAMGWGGIERFLEDVRHAARGLIKDWRFTSVAVLVLALGIAGNTTVFSLAEALLLNPFPYPDANRLVAIRSRADDGSWYSSVRVADFGYWRQQATAFEGMAAYGYSRSNLTDQSAAGFDGPERIVVGRATDSFLRVLGVAPALGRFFTAAEDRPGGPNVVVLSYGAWMRRYGGRTNVIGETLTLDGTVRSVVGVMPANLRLPGMFTCEVWIPAAYDVAANMKPGFDTRWDGDHVVGRLRRGAGPEQAQAELNVLVTRLERELPRRTKGWQVRVAPVAEEFAEDQATRLRLLALVVGTGLVLACANLAGLLLARGSARSRETAVRAALGASRPRLVRSALTETLLIAIAGGSLGLVLTSWSIAAVASAAPPFMGLDSALRVDATVIVFALGVSLATGLAFGIIPAIRGSRADLTAVLKNSPAVGTRTGNRILSGLVIAEVGLALLLLVGGGLLGRSLLTLARVDTGIRVDNLLTFRLSLSESKYESASRRRQFSDALLEQLRRVPGVTGAAAVVPLPMSGEYSGGGFRIEGRPAPANWRDMSAQYCQATPRYFQAMGIPVVLGREFEDSDGVARPVVIVNRAFARRYFAGENPLGQRLASLGTIVGVVGEVRHNGPAFEPTPQIYFPFAVRPPRTLSVVVRTTGQAMAAGPLVREQVRALDRGLPIDRMKPMADVVGESISAQRLMAMLVGGFAVFALLLAAIGLYGVIAYSVNRRQHEIGIRMALGASRRVVLARELSRGALLAILGIAAGAPAAFGASRLMTAFLYGVEPHDPAVFTGVASLLLLVALLASYLPARRAAAVDPLASLRVE